MLTFGPLKSHLNKPPKILLLKTPFSSMEEALLLIDIQNDYFPGGKMELADMEKQQKRQQNFLKHSVLQASRFSL
jgi:hypothetical protein